MKRKYLIMAAVSLTIVVTAISSCQHEGTSEEELSERISRVRQGDGSYKLVNTETGKTLIKDVDVDWLTYGKDSLAVFSKDRKRGYFNVNTGEIIIEPTYKHAWIFSEGLAGVVKNDKVGFINKNGEVVIDFQFPYRGNMLQEFVFHNGRCVVANEDQRLGAIDSLGNWIIEPKYDNVFLSKDYAVVGNKGEFKQQIDYQGHVIMDCVIDGVFDLYYTEQYVNQTTGCPENARVLNTDFYEYRVNGGCGLMNKNGVFLTKPIYSSISGMGQHLFRAVLQDRCSEVFINEQGKVLHCIK